MFQLTKTKTKSLFNIISSVHNFSQFYNQKFYKPNISKMAPTKTKGYNKHKSQNRRKTNVKKDLGDRTYIYVQILKVNIIVSLYIYTL